MKRHNYPLSLFFIIIVCCIVTRGSSAQTPEPGKVVFALHVTLSPTWFDPIETPAQITPFAILYALHDALVRPLPGERMGPALAASWKESPDGLTYEFTLRQGLQFHNGDPCTAEDVQYSFTRYKGTGAKELQTKVQRIEVVDSLTIRFHLREPWPDFMTMYATTATAAGIVVPKKYVEQVGEEGFKQRPVGLGPYKFVSYTPGGDLVLEAFQGYWRKIPHIRRLVIKGIPEETTRLAMLKTGEVDMAFAMEGRVAEGVRSDPQLSLAYTLHPSSIWLEFPEQWQPKSVWADKRIRLAVNHALDRQTINEATCLGYCPPAGVMIPRVMEYALPAEPVPYNVQRARELLAEAGYPNGFDAGELTPIPPFFTIGEAVLNALQAIGIRARMTTMERVAFLALWREKKLRGLFIAGSGTAGNAATRIESFICSQGTFAYGGYPDLDALCQQQSAERQRTRRETLLHRIQHFTIDRVMFAPIMDFRALIGLGPRIAEHALDTIPSYAFPAWEDVRLKGNNTVVSGQASPSMAAALAPAAGQTGGSGAVAADTENEASTLVVLGGVVTPSRLQRKVSGYRHVPYVGFSVQSTPHKTLAELIAAGRITDTWLSVTTVSDLKKAGQSLGMNLEVIAAPGPGFHSIVVTPRVLSSAAAQALSKAFHQMPSPLLRPQVQQ